MNGSRCASSDFWLISDVVSVRRKLCFLPRPGIPMLVGRRREERRVVKWWSKYHLKWVIIYNVDDSGLYIWRKIDRKLTMIRDAQSWMKERRRRFTLMVLDVRFTSWRVPTCNASRKWSYDWVDYHECNAFRVWQVIVVAEKIFKKKIAKGISFPGNKMASLYMSVRVRPSHLRASDLIWLLRLII